MNPTIDSASVKVMRSYDYCHFEVCLSSTEARTTEDVDNLRKEAARLADKAVTQYKTAKEEIHRRESDEHNLPYMKQRQAEILEVPESERTPEEKALVKQVQDIEHRLSRSRYNYDDEWDDQWDDEDDDYL